MERRLEGGEREEGGRVLKREREGGGCLGYECIGYEEVCIRYECHVCMCMCVV